MKNSNLPESTIVLSGRFPKAHKNRGIGNEVDTSRYVTQDQIGKMKNILVHDASAPRRNSIEMVLSHASVKRF